MLTPERRLQAYAEMSRDNLASGCGTPCRHAGRSSRASHRTGMQGGQSVYANSFSPSTSSLVAFLIAVPAFFTSALAAALLAFFSPIAISKRS